jgi:hypothetical protein
MPAANSEIGARLRISTYTVKSHVRDAMEKTGLRTRVLLALSAKADPGRRRPAQATSNRSAFMTLVHAATKSRTNFCCASSAA